MCSLSLHRVSSRQSVLHCHAGNLIAPCPRPDCRAAGADLDFMLSVLQRYHIIMYISLVGTISTPKPKLSGHLDGLDISEPCTSRRENRRSPPRQPAHRGSF